jgi:hypothetical protein
VKAPKPVASVVMRAHGGTTAAVMGPPAAGPLALRLQEPAQQEESSRRVVWGDGVVDNEGLGKRKSKRASPVHPEQR